MTMPAEERVLRYTLQLGVDPLDHVQKEIRETIAEGERDAAEVMWLEADRRRRIESESIGEPERQQRQTLAQPPELPRRDAKRAAAAQPVVADGAKRDFAVAQAPRPMPNNRTAPPTAEAATANQRPLQVEVKAKREYIVKVEEDVDQLVERIAEQINTQLAEREQVILWRLNKRLADFVASRSR